VKLDKFLINPKLRTPVYCKPLLIEPGKPPRELSRFDSKNWKPTPGPLSRELADRVAMLGPHVDVILLMDQVDRPETGVVTAEVREAAHAASLRNQGLLVLADSRQGLRHFPPLCYKMNAAELAAMTGKTSANLDLATIQRQAADLAERTGQPVFITLAERGIIGARPGKEPVHVPSLTVIGPIDIVGAGDAVTASLAAAIAAGAEASEAMELAMIAASIVIHQLGTTGTAPIASIADRLGFPLP
jgi:bifunctional ADP-heptose synthase (sugar kinase/adenylyltransferase)